MHPEGGFVDSHCHLTMEAFDGDREEALDRARAAGVHSILVVSSSIGDEDRLLAFAASHPGVWAAAGVHPHEAKDYTDAVEAVVRRSLAHQRAVALGEIGLDYHYDRSPREVQRDVFRRQLRLARESARPVIIHTREAQADTLHILEQEEASRIGGVFHCFTENEQTAQWALENGFFVSFSGVLTFKSSEGLRAVARRIPLGRTLIETDSPFLAPVPLRGQRNEPAHVRRVAGCLAALHGVTEEEVGRITSDGFFSLFGLFDPARADT